MNYQAKYKTHTGVHIHRKNPRVKKGTSKEEAGLYNQIVMDFPSLRIYRSNRQILNGREIDIYIPSCHLGIEYNGNRWHSSEMDKAENYHLSKSIMAERKGVKLIHIFSDMWENRKVQVTDLIRKKLGKYSEVTTRQCSLVKLDLREGYEFLNMTSVNQPDPRISDYVGFMKGSKILAVLGYNTEDKTIYDYQDMIGLKIKNPIKKILETYPELEDYQVRCDRSILKQDFWIAEGYTPIECTKPRPYYTKDFKTRIRATTLHLTESKLKELGWKTIYDCGEVVLKKEKV